MADTNLDRRCKIVGLTMEAMRGAPREDWPDADPWICRLDCEGRSLVVPFYSGKGNRKKPFGGGDPRPLPPRVAEVIACLVSDASSGRDTFEEFCSNMDANPDSIRDRRMWEACVRTDADLSRLLGSLLAEVEEAAQDF